MKPLTLKLIIPLTLISFALFTKCRYHSSVDPSGSPKYQPQNTTDTNESPSRDTGSFVYKDSEVEIITDFETDTIIINDTILPNQVLFAVKSSLQGGKLFLKDRTTRLLMQVLPYELHEGSDISHSIETGDYNFDGNLDICLPNGINKDEAISPYAYNVFLFNPSIGNFEKAKDIGEVMSSGDGHELIKEKNFIVIYRRGGSTENYYDVYKIRNNKVCHIQWLTESYSEYGKVTVSVIKTLCNGKDAGKEKLYQYPAYPADYDGKGYYYNHIMQMTQSH